MVPTNRETFKEYCLRKLGEPVIQVNVAVEQLDDRIDEALYKYYESHSKALEETILLYDITADNVSKQHITLPEDVASVVDVYTPSIGGGITSADWAVTVAELYSMTSAFRYGDMSYYYMNRMHLSLINRFFNPEINYTWNESSNRLQLIGGFASLYAGGKTLAIRCMKRVNGDTDTLDSNGDPVGFNIWKDRWLQEYSCALIKEQWAQNLSKYTGIELLGGVQLNSEKLAEEAKAERTKLEEELITRWQYPPKFFVG